MLKALELVGFKSFADKTRFEFPPGITVIVGPNGSGKSNIVDAIKWVLGEQSVKSLRGKEMADCIFNGSAGRRALNCAETTLVFDNQSRLLAVDAPEVHVTRRVYRSGEGEYLINRQPSRLRDIRDLFAGTGVTTEAYSVIEQGKVDVLLQSSARDRRLIFEEAAGISRFKAKKIEAARRLERVEQNLLRLSDIVDEVDNRLKSVRLQAGKARRYKEYADRLQQLRTQVALVDWRKLTASLSGLESELQTLTDEIGTQTAQAEQVEARALALDVEAAEADRAIRATETRAAQNRERIAGCDSTIEHERRRARDLEEEVSRFRRQLVAMNLRAGDLHQHLQATSEQLAGLDRQHRLASLNLAEQERLLTQCTAELDEAQRQTEQCRSEHLAQLAAAGALGNQMSALSAKATAADLARERGQQRTHQLAAARDQIDALLSGMVRQLDGLAHAAADQQALLRATQGRLVRRRQVLTRAQQALAELRERHAAASERAAVLEELDRRLEGVAAGVRDLMVQARSATEGPLRQIHGLLADLVRVAVEWSTAVETALGPAAQGVVVSDVKSVAEHVQSRAINLSGPVTFLPLGSSPHSHAAAIDLGGRPGVIARADCLAQAAPQYAALAERLLGQTWVVESLADALALQGSAGAGLSFVTRTGELLAADASLTLGPRHGSAGLISRRSERRALGQQIAALAAEIERGAAECLQMEAEIAADEAQLAEATADYERLSEQLAGQRLEAGAAQERRAQLQERLSAIEAESIAAGQEHEEAAAVLAETRGRLADGEARIRERADQIAALGTRLSQLEQARQRQQREVAAVKVELARSEQQLDGLRAQKAQLERDRQERGRALAETRAQLLVCLERLKESERTILRSESEVAALYLRKESLAGEVVRQVNRRETYRDERSQLAAESQRLRARARKLETKLHAKELCAGELRHERTTLADRMREDYQIELADFNQQGTPEQLHERQAVEQEIADLRGKLNSIGAVNLDALAELEQLEARHCSLAAQYQDLASAKNSLEQIIHKINADSRRLFAETLEVVRGHFQALFRKLFGGGQADIVLEEGVDILESGIEIVARPPGKEPRSISLLSGGEKTLTCVALLLAIFRSRPSPFCVLDEVDAALDEANIERFIGVLREFLAWTQFIIVTHSKKTMTCADTLYGVTMQESGVSKRVAVRFEDVSETGEILNVRESDGGAAAEDDTQAA